MTTTPSTNDLTRQQLEELDALLQRMLAAPTVAAAPLPPTSEILSDNWRLDRPTPRSPHLDLPAPAAEPRLSVETAPLPEPRHVEDRHTPPPAVHVPAPLALTGEDQVNPADVTDDDLPTLSGFKLPAVPVTPSMPYNPPDLIPLQRETVPAALPHFGRLNIADLKSAPVEVVEQPVASASQPVATDDGIPVLAWPLFAANWVAEECLKVFGGESLTKPAAKWSLGLTGVLMMVAAAAWTLHGFGAVTIPIK